MGLVLRRDGRFEHAGIPVTHPRLHAALLRGVRFSQAEGVFVTCVRQFRGQIEVEDTAFFVVSFDPTSGEIELSDETRERLDPGALTVDRDDVLRARVKGGRFAARFTRAGQAHLLDSIDASRDPPALQIANVWHPLPGLAEPARAARAPGPSGDPPGEAPPRPGRPGPEGES
ncbi:MAG: hypothetical protein ACE5IL_07405 [Myxococcota bacterium]